MENKLTISLSGFEQLSEAIGQSLVGGFSVSFSLSDAQSSSLTANNCRGGNCAVLCGSNVGCNAVAGCSPSIPPQPNNL